MPQVKVKMSCLMAKKKKSVRNRNLTVRKSHVLRSNIQK